MDLDGRLTLVLRDCTWANEPNVALRLVPDLAQDCPPITEVPLGDGNSVLGIAWGGEAELLSGTAEVVDRLLGRALRGAPREDFSGLSRADLARDPMCAPYCRVLAQTDVPAFHVQALPMLAAARMVGRCFQPDPKELTTFVRAEVVERLVQHADQFRRLPVARRAEVLSDVAWGFGARTNACFAGVFGSRVRPVGLSRRIAADPLAICLRKGTLDADPDLVLVAMVAALPVSGGVLQHVRSAASLAFDALQDRRGKGKSLVIDELLVQAVRELRTFPSTADRLLLHPTAGPLLVGALPELVDARTLEKEGVPKEVAKTLTRRESIQGLAACWGDLVDALLVWDVLSTLMSKIVPITAVGTQVQGVAGPLPAHPRWTLLVPRGASLPSEAAVVAVRLTEVIEHLRKVDELVPPAHVVERAWNESLRAAPGALACMQSEHGIAVFADASEALAFASQFLAGLAVAGFDRGEGERVQLPDLVHASAGVAWGRLSGGTDGNAVVLGGSSVARAVSLAGTGSPIGACRDPLGMSRILAGPKGLQSSGVVCDGWIAAKVLDAAKARQLPIHVHGTKVEVAGAATDFVQVPVRAWWHEADWVSCICPLDPTEPGGAAEYLHLPRPQFRRFHRQDQNLPMTEEEIEPTAPPADVAVRSTAPLRSRPSREAPSVATRPAGVAGGGPAKSIPMRSEDVDDPISGVAPTVLRVPQVSFGLDVPEAAHDDAPGGYADDLWGPEEDATDAASVERLGMRRVRQEATHDPDSLGDAISYDGPVVSIEETDDPRSNELVLPPVVPLADWEEEVPTDGSGKSVPDPLPDPEMDGGWITEMPKDVAFGGSTMTVRPLDRREVRPADPWDEQNTDPNIRPYPLDALGELEESDPTDERKAVAGSGLGRPRAADYGTRLPPHEAAPLADPAMPVHRSTRAAPDDLGPMLVGYVCLQVVEGFTFGRIYGNRLVDVHAYATSDQRVAYGNFLKDKIAEGFVPRMELTSFLPEDAEVRAVDLHLLNATYQAMVSP
jgi:hypothetical protein